MTPLVGENFLPHARHLGAAAAPARDARRDRPLAPWPRARDTLRHRSEQYLRVRLRVENALPHFLHLTRFVLAAFFAARAMHCAQ